MALALGPRRETQCRASRAVRGEQHWCPDDAVAGDPLCARHQAERRRRAIPDPPPVQRQAIPPAGGELARLAVDRQNVHTRAVNAQSRIGEALLLSVPTDGRPVLVEITHALTALPDMRIDALLRVLNDVTPYDRMTSVRTPDDRLYSRMLAGLWAMIQQRPPMVRDELIKRLWQELTESVGMCFEGHISRLVNVMVGFDDAFTPPVCVNELLQAKLAAISVMDVTLAERVAQANAYMDELHVPPERRVAWLEALE